MAGAVAARPIQPWLVPIKATRPVGCGRIQLCPGAACPDTWVPTPAPTLTHSDDLDHIPLPTRASVSPSVLMMVEGRGQSHCCMHAPCMTRSAGHDPGDGAVGFRLSRRDGGRVDRKPDLLCSPQQARGLAVLPEGERGVHPGRPPQQPCRPPEAAGVEAAGERDVPPAPDVEARPAPSLGRARFVLATLAAGRPDRWTASPWTGQGTASCPDARRAGAFGPGPCSPLHTRQQTPDWLTDGHAPTPQAHGHAHSPAACCFPIGWGENDPCRSSDF